MQGVLKKIFNIHEGEGKKVALMFSYIFLIITSLLIVKPVRNSLFISEFGVKQLPIVFILVALVSAVVSTIYAKFANKLRLNRLIISTLIISIASLLFFWFLLAIDYQAAWFLYTLYIWVAIYGLIVTTQFWLLANYVFRARQAKRLFGILGAGAISGGIFGGYLTNYLAGLIGTKNLIFICIASLLVCLILLRSIWRSSEIDIVETSGLASREKEKTSSNPIKLILKSKHLLYLSGMISVSVIVANLVDYQFSAIAAEVITDKDKLTAFFGFWLSNLSVLSLFIQLFLTTRVLNNFGIRGSLLFLPVGILAGAIAVLFQPVLWAAVVLKVSDGSFKQSIHKAGLELLSLPIPTHIKNKTKAFIDVFIDNLSTGIGGILLLFCTYTLHWTASQISYIVILLVFVWLFLVQLVKDEYVNSFRKAIEQRTLNLDEENIYVRDASVMGGMLDGLFDKNERQILYVLNLLENSGYNKLIPILQDLIYHPSTNIKQKVLELSSSYSQLDLRREAEKLITNENDELRIEALRYLISYSDQGKVILDKYLNSDNPMEVSAAFICAAEIISEDPKRKADIDLQNIMDKILDRIKDKVVSQTNQTLFARTSAVAIGISRDERLYPYLKLLLKNKDIEICKIAVDAAGKTQAKEFIPALVKIWDNKYLRYEVIKALSGFGDPVIEPLKAIFNDSDSNLSIRTAIPRVLSNIGTQSSVNMLLDNIEVSNLTLRMQCIKSLNKLKEKYPVLLYNQKVIENSIENQIASLYKILHIYSVEIAEQKNNSKSIAAVKSGRKLLIDALYERLYDDQERIFRLLGLRYSSKEMYDAYIGVMSRRTDLKENAIEFLDNVIDKKFKKSIIPIVESKSVKMLMDDYSDLMAFEFNNESDCLVSLIEDSDNWLKTCALYMISVKNENISMKLISEQIESPEPTVREIADLIMQKYQLHD
jgi:ATP:ADP antiporter, AAA family